MDNNLEEFSNLNEDQLIELLKLEDEKAFIYIIKKFSGKMFSISKRYKINKEDAEDCIQQTFLKVFQNIKRFEKRSSLWTWVRKILINIIIDKLNKSKRVPEISVSDLLPKFDKDDCRIEPEWMFSNSIKNIVAKDESKKLFYAALEQLPSKYKLILLLHDIDGYTIFEISKKLNINLNTVKTRLHRGRSSLKKQIEEFFV